VRHYIYKHARGERNFSALKFLWNSPFVLLVRVRRVRKLNNESKAVGSVPLCDYSVHEISWAFSLNFVFCISGVAVWRNLDNFGVRNLDENVAVNDDRAVRTARIGTWHFDTSWAFAVGLRITFIELVKPKFLEGTCERKWQR
jgi:hypothetical protein